MGQAEFDFSPSYIAGLLDATGRVRFPISETDDGRYTVHPALRIYPYKTSMRANVIGSFLESQGYSYNFIERTHSRDFFRIQFVSELSSLQTYLENESAHLVRELEFVTETFTDKFDNEILTPKSIHRFLRTRDRLRYGWRPRGIHHVSPSDIDVQSEVDGESDNLPTIPEGTFRKDYSIKYIAGLFDGRARFRPSIAESSEHKIGYQMHPITRLYRGGVNPTLIRRVQEFCRDYNLRVGDSSEDTTLNVVFSGPGAIRRVLEVIYPQLYVVAEPAAILDDAVLPRFGTNDHLTKQGFYEILTVLEQIAAQSGGASRRRDYTAEFFADLWGDELETEVSAVERETERQTEAPDSEPDQSAPSEELESVTLNPAAYGDESGRYHTVVDRHHRDQGTVAELKALYSDRCQVCGDRRARPDGTGFSEVHHIRPLGNPHNGPDTPGNMLVLCPNHHADFDNGVITVDSNSRMITHPYDRSVDGRELMTDESHTISTTQLLYHEENIATSVQEQK